jgi:hypothetical protein
VERCPSTETMLDSGRRVQQTRSKERQRTRSSPLLFCVGGPAAKVHAVGYVGRCWIRLLCFAGLHSRAADSTVPEPDADVDKPSGANPLHRHNDFSVRAAVPDVGEGIRYVRSTRQPSTILVAVSLV